MKRSLWILVVAGFATAMLEAQERSVQARVAEAVSPLPTSLRDGAEVITWDAKGNRKVVREGNNGIICASNHRGNGFVVRCFTKVLEPEEAMYFRLIGGGKTPAEARSALQAERQAGKFPTPPAGTMEYVKSGKSGAEPGTVWILILPNAKAESLGLPTKPGNGSPWMMMSGTPSAHVMIPQTEANLASAPKNP